VIVNYVTILPLDPENSSSTKMIITSFVFDIVEVDVREQASNE
jgi:hypothetical protein